MGLFAGFVRFLLVIYVCGACVWLWVDVGLIQVFCFLLVLFSVGLFTLMLFGFVFGGWFMVVLIDV